MSKHLSDMMSEHNIDAEDAVYAELRADGWNDTEAAFYAFHLTYSDAVAIKRWITRHVELHPGNKDAIISLKSKTDMRMAREAKSAAAAEKRIEEEVERRLNEEIAKMKSSIASDGDETLSNAEISRVYVKTIRDPHADPKEKNDAIKGYVSLHPEVRISTEEEDNKINFFLPVNCHYCDRCRNCELKSELESRGCRIRAKRTSPYLWELVDTDEKDNLK